MASAIDAVLSHGQFILGPEVDELERRLGVDSRVEHVISCASGTDALVLALLALGIGPGDGVAVPSFTFAATAEAVVRAGATPVFCDVDARTFNLRPEAVEAAADACRRRDLRPAAVIAVDLFGQPAENQQVSDAAGAVDMDLVVDAAQSYGATRDERSAVSFGTMATTSFFPSKPLGCYGDGGALFTDDGDVASVLRSLRSHGGGSDKYDAVRIGTNSRLDTIQAAVLLVKLEVLDDELRHRAAIAARYSAELDDVLTVPDVGPTVRSSWAQYTCRTERRDALVTHLADAGVPTAVYYRAPLHLQEAYRGFPRVADELPVSDDLARTVVSLPIHGYLTDAHVDRVIEATRSFAF